MLYELKNGEMEQTFSKETISYIHAQVVEQYRKFLLDSPVNKDPHVGGLFVIHDCKLLDDVACNVMVQWNCDRNYLDTGHEYISIARIFLYTGMPDELLDFMNELKKEVSQ